MCGVAGIFHYAEPERPVDRAALVAMTRRLAHRGPDGEGVYIDGNLGLGHRRLAIVDLSPTGAQPMLTPDRGAVIAYNGELYNHRVFRAQLEARGVRFRGSSDTETLLHWMREDGPDALAMAQGIFSFALWERDRKTLTLARDPLGVKQLYLYDDGQSVRFASELKALTVCRDVPRRIDPDAVNEYLHFHTPLFDRTFLRDIKVLRAGEYVQFRGAARRHRRYWQLSDFRWRTERPEAQVEALKAELSAVVRDQLMADVAVGSFFSGGIDSTAVAAFATRASMPPRCFGVHFTGQGVIDERPFQEAAARRLGLDLELITLDGSRFAEDLRTLLYYQDQPLIGAAMLPMFAVAELAASRVKVCVGGQAADEIFGGYARYALVHPERVAADWLSARLSARLQRRSGALRDTASGEGSNLGKQLSERKTLARISGLARRGLTEGFDYQSRYFDHFSKVPGALWASAFAAPGFYHRGAARTRFTDALAASPAHDPADKVMHWDLQTYLTGLFTQDDRMSMAHSLESRVPMADPRLVRFAFKTPYSLKFRAGASKWILREAVRDVIPHEVLTRRKVGFDTPAERWMRETHRGFVADTLLGRRARERGFWDHRGLEATLADTQNPYWFDLVWKFLSIETWAQVVLDGDGPAYETLRDPIAAAESA